MSTEAVETHEAEHAEEHHSVYQLRKTAMWVFLGSECVFFGAMISTFLLYRNTTGDGPTASDIFDIPFTSASSFVLLMSSLTMVLALTATAIGTVILFLFPTLPLALANHLFGANG